MCDELDSTCTHCRVMYDIALKSKFELNLEHEGYTFCWIRKYTFINITTKAIMPYIIAIYELFELNSFLKQRST